MIYYHRMHPIISYDSILTSKLLKFLITYDGKYRYNYFIYKMTKHYEMKKLRIFFQIDFFIF